MKIKIPAEVEKIVKNIGNRTRQKNAYKIYAVFFLNSYKTNKEGYFPLPATFLKQINSRYSEIVNCFLENKIIDYDHRFEILIETGEILKTKRYNVEKGICMKYKFLIDPSKGISKKIDLENKKSFRWYEIIRNSLNELGYDYNISRAAFGRRVYYGLIQKYKNELKDKGFCMIDAKCSQPKLLLQELKKNNIDDKNYEKAFKNDFYIYLAENLNLNSRDDAKELFMYYLNSNGYVPNNKIYSLFPEASLFLKNLKKGNYKNSADFFQKIESQIWINDLLENLPVAFGLPIHDCLIVKEKDAELVFKYCKKKYPKIDFVVSKLRS